MNDENLMNNSFKEQLENSLVHEDDDSKDNLKKVHCIIKAIYQLSFNDYLQKNGLSASDLNDKNDLAQFRRLSAWPSQSRFVFSLKQMRDSYEHLAKNAVASKLLSEHQKEEALARTKTKTEFWSILGEGPTVEESFHVFENDETINLEKMRLLAYAFRLVLFQNKITQFRETGNFLELLKSVNRKVAQEAFDSCVGILPFSQDFFNEDIPPNEDIEPNEDMEPKKDEIIEDKVIEGKTDEKTILKTLIENVSNAIVEFDASIQQARKLAEIIQQAVKDNMAYCENASFEEDDFLANNEPIVHGIDLI